jgi:hypothetical protein
VTGILDGLRYAYYQPHHTNVYSFFNNEKEVGIIFNESQNLINKEWITEGMKYAKEYIDIQKIQVVSL